jgi:CubicO group peptidase (beta-lactamase class C family)
MPAERSACVNDRPIVSLRGADSGLLASGGAVPVPWWSFTKALLATAVLRLVDAGRLPIDAPLPGEPFSIRQLLQHTSGLGDYGELAEYHEAVVRGDTPWSVDEMLTRAGASRLRYPTGGGWRYSNIGYLKLRQRIEQVTGLDLGAALAEIIFKPTGMKFARVATKSADLADVSMGATHGYDPRWVYHGLVVGPLDEATLFLQRLLQGTLLSRELMAEMQAGYDLPEFASATASAPSYGLGLMLGEATPGLRVGGHAGGGPGSSLAVFGCERPEGIVVAAVWRPDEKGDEAQAAVTRLLASA